MKKGIPTILLLFISCSLFSQQEGSNHKNDIGLNVNAILNKVIYKKVNDEIINPFPDQLSVLTYRHFYSQKSALRVGIGFDKFYRNDTIFSNFSGILIEEDKFQFYAIHFGVQKNVLDNKKVKLSVGWDWIFRRESQKRKMVNDFSVGGGIFFEDATQTNFYLENYIGFSLPVGMQYFFNENIFISTEFSLEIFQTFSKDKTEFNGNSNNDFRDNEDLLNLKFRPPFALFIHYRF